MAIVVATTDFAISFPDVKFVMTNFSGTLVPEERGSVLIRYTIASQIPVPVGQIQVQVQNHINGGQRAPGSRRADSNPHV